MTAAWRHVSAALVAASALWSCSPGDPLDRTLPVDRIGQDGIADTLPEPQRNHFRIYLAGLRSSADSAELPTIREAIAVGRQRAANEAREVSDMRAMLENSTGSAGKNKH